MAQTNETLEFKTRNQKLYSTAVTGFNGHTATLQFKDEGGWQDVLDDSGSSIVFTEDGQGTFASPTNNMRWLIVPGTGDLNISVRSTHRN
jgi:hypothetical protein